MSDETLSGNNIWLLPTTADTALHLTDEPALDYHPTWAADGCAIYFVSTRTGSSNIFRLAIDPKTGSPKGKPQQVTFFSDAEIIFPKVLGDGGRIAFGLSKTTSSIRVADASRPDEARTLVRGYAPQLSPEGQTIYYLGEGPGMAGIFSVPTKGGIPRRLTQHRPVPSYAPGFHLSPNGQSIAYFTELDEGRGLFSLPASGGQPQLLLKIDTKEDVVPQWSPDGLKLAYAYGNGLYVVPAGGGPSSKLAHLDQWQASTVRWSPDGKYLAAFGHAKPPTEKAAIMNAVFVAPASGGEPRQLTPSDLWKEGLEWHPDGQRLTYHVEQAKSETRQVYLDGRPPSLLVDHHNPTFWDHVGKWAPDGRRFFFDSANVDTNEWGIYIYDEPSGDITLFAPNASLPNWSGDGKMMVWESHKHVNQIWLAENFLPKSEAVK
ncbi:PD40 domain-containing protein [bacterium]|nr:PD40 domain-containing protein [bacterium]